MIKGKTVDERVWNYLMGKIGNAYGVAGVMGNLQAESGIIFGRVEILCLKRLMEHGKAYTDATYTDAVDNGSISRSEFLNPLPRKQYGYGLCQWTSPGRKAGLYDLCKSRHVSISDEQAQLDWLMTELEKSYVGVLNTLKNAKSVKEASDCFLMKFEIPDDCGSAVKNARAAYGQKFYAKYANNTQAVSQPAATGIDQKIRKVIDVATAEIGYLEKRSAASLDDKTANAGSANITKYWRDVYPSFQGQPWCACFVSWVLMQVFGKDGAKKLLKHWPYTYCPTLAGMTSNGNPKPGSVVIFYRNGTFTHTGIVIEVNGSSITTVEGNTSGGSGVIANGGGVCKKTYQLGNLHGTRFFMPDYGSVPVVGVSDTAQASSQHGSGSVAPGTFVESGKHSPSPKPLYSMECTADCVNVRTQPVVNPAYISKYVRQLNTGDNVLYCDKVTTNGCTWLFVRISTSAHPDGYVYDYVCADYFRKA